jgi:hypothetical protein
MGFGKTEYKAGKFLSRPRPFLNIASTECCDHYAGQGERRFARPAVGASLSESAPPARCASRSAGTSLSLSTIVPENAAYGLEIRRPAQDLHNRLAPGFPHG